jgi:hypothetical protein
MNPWEEKRLIEYCFELAAECGFKLVRDHRYGHDKVSLQAADDIETVWAKDMTLESFNDWWQAMTFLAGYRKAMMFVANKGKWK